MGTGRPNHNLGWAMCLHLSSSWPLSLYIARYLGVVQGLISQAMGQWPHPEDDEVHTQKNSAAPRA